MVCCITNDIREGTFHATNSISILPKGFPQVVSKTASKKILATQYSTDMELDEAEKKALHELLLALDSQRPMGCCGCCCTSSKEFANIMSKIEEMHMAYQIQACCYHVNQVLLTKTGNVTKARKFSDKSTEVPHGVMMYPGDPRILTNHILSDEERNEVSNLKKIGAKQTMNASRNEVLLMCLVTSLYSLGIGIVTSMCVTCCMACCNCRNYQKLRHSILNTGSARSINILEEWCWTVNTVEYRPFSYPAFYFDPTAVVPTAGSMER